MSASGISLHIGLNRVDPNHYNGWEGALQACEFDAKDLEAIAKKQRFKSQTLLTTQATAQAVSAGIRAAAARLVAGDLFLLTYSGHGGQVPDTNHDETVLPSGQEDRQDETWVLYDRQLVDDELYSLWARFKSWVRIFVLSDSCHSGTVVKLSPKSLAGAGAPARCKFLPYSVASATYRLHKETYVEIQKQNVTAEKAKVRATVLLISGCQDNQYSLDGDRNGLFTSTVRQVWSNGKFQGAYRSFRDTVASRMPPAQTPNYFVTGRANPEFEAQKPFSI